jgi:iron complex outermembrane receptor protein
MSYRVKKLSVGTNLTYFGNVSTEGFGDVPTDANPNVFVSSLYTYKGKLVSDVFGSYKICKSVTLLAGVDNIFNVHPLLSINPLAKNANANNESGGPWDSVQMGFNGRRLFTKLAINF